MTPKFKYVYVATGNVPTQFWDSGTNSLASSTNGFDCVLFLVYKVEKVFKTRVRSFDNWKLYTVREGTDGLQKKKKQKFILLNRLKPTGHVIHQQFNIQQLYVLRALYLCVLYLSESKQRLVPLTA